MKKFFSTKALKWHGPYLHIKGMTDKSAFESKFITSENQDKGIIAKRLIAGNDAHNTSLRSLALGEETDSCVFYTTIKPSVEEVFDGLENFPGWEQKDLETKWRKKVLPIEKAFEVVNGEVTVHEKSELLQQSFPEVFDDLQSSVNNKQ